MKYDTRHGGPYDRGSADRYYGRSFYPHYYKGNTHASEMVEERDMTEEEIEGYTAGYDDEFDRKEW